MGSLGDHLIRRALGRQPVRYDCEACRTAGLPGNLGFTCRACGAVVCRQHYVADYDMCRVCADREMCYELDNDPYS